MSYGARSAEVSGSHFRDRRAEIAGGGGSHGGHCSTTSNV